MSGVLLRRRGVEAKITTGGPFNPLTYISWSDVYWAEDSSWTNPGDGNGVSSWRDAGSRALNLAQATGGNQPIYRSSVAGLNSKPAVQFDGVDDYMTTSNGSAVAQSYTQVVVLLPSPAGSASVTSVAGSNATRGIGWNSSPFPWVMAYGTVVVSATNVTNAAHLLFGFASGASSSLKLDGSSIASGNAGTTSINQIRLGATSVGSATASAYIPFYGLVNRALTGTEETDLRSWAQSYYGTP